MHRQTRHILRTLSEERTQLCLVYILKLLTEKNNIKISFSTGAHDFLCLGSRDLIWPCVKVICQLPSLKTTLPKGGCFSLVNIEFF